MNVSVAYLQTSGWEPPQSETRLLCWQSPGCSGSHLTSFQITAANGRQFKQSLLITVFQINVQPLYCLVFYSDWQKNRCLLCYKNTQFFNLCGQSNNDLLWPRKCSGYMNMFWKCSGQMSLANEIFFSLHKITYHHIVHFHVYQTCMVPLYAHLILIYC